MTPLAVSPRDVDRFRDLLRARLGICLPGSRILDVEQAIRQAADAAQVGDADSLYRLLVRRMDSETGETAGETAGEAEAGDAAGQAEVATPLDALVAGLNLGETYFFRDAGQMQALEQRILPELIDRRGGQRRLRVWSAGCSTGEEAYTLAMLVQRLTAGVGGWTVSVLGTDVNGESLRRARRGVYRSWSLRGIPPGVLGLYLLPRPDGVEVAPRIRAMVSFARLNLAGDGYPSPATGTDAMDLILCRNVLLYFGEAEAGAVAGRLRRALAADGWLLLSQVEARFGAVDGLRRADGELAAFRRVPDPATAAEAYPVQPHSVAGPAVRNPYPHPVPTASGPPGLDAAERATATRVVSAAAAPAAPAHEAGPLVGDGVEPSGAVEESGGAVGCARALRLWRDGEHGHALVVLAGEAARAPLLPGTHYLSGLILLDRGRTVAALAAFRRCTYADPSFVLGYVGQAGVLVRAGQRRRAGAALDTASGLLATLDPDGSVPDGTPSNGTVPGSAVPGGAAAGAVAAVGGVRVAEVWGLLAEQRRLLDLGVGAGHD